MLIFLPVEKKKLHQAIYLTPSLVELVTVKEAGDYWSVDRSL